MFFTALWTIPTGIVAAIYLEEYANPTGRINRLIEVNILNLAAVPSIIFGILGLAFISRGLGFGPTILTGSLTLALLVLPDRGHRQPRGHPGRAPVDPRWDRWPWAPRSGRPSGARCCRRPSRAWPPASILALSRAIGEAAPLIMLGIGFVRFNPDGLLSALHRAAGPDLQLDHRVARPEFKELAAAASVVLLVILLAMNSIAIYIRNKTQKRW